LRCLGDNGVGDGGVKCDTFLTLELSAACLKDNNMQNNSLNTKIY